MKILAIDTSAKAASAAVGDGEQILAEFGVNVKITHSQTLMPMVESLLACSGLSLGQLDGFAVNSGPGSFTGLRIGIAAVKGLAFALDKPCIGISTLDSIARGLPLVDGIICAAMDARCGQVYTALFESMPGSLRRLTDDLALTLESLSDELSKYKKNVFFVGDGAQLCYNKWEHETRYFLAPPNVCQQRASGVLLAAREHWAAGAGSAAELAPAYLRLPQAERERLKKNGQASLP